MKIFYTAIVFFLLIPVCLNAQDNCECCPDGIGAGTQYRPNDPWTKGRFWLRQTGHFGLFYNCDCEEKKRCSPHICWKNSGSPFVGQRWLADLRCDWRDMKQRILDGTQCCDGKSRRRTPSKSCHCESCD